LARSGLAFIFSSVKPVGYFNGGREIFEILLILLLNSGGKELAY